MVAGLYNFITSLGKLIYGLATHFLLQYQEYVSLAWVSLMCFQLEQQQNKTKTNQAAKLIITQTVHLYFTKRDLRLNIWEMKTPLNIFKVHNVLILAR